MKNNSKKPKSYKLQAGKGFTLVELLLYVAIVGTLIFFLAGFMSLLMQSRVKNQTISEVEQQGLQVMQLVGQTIRNAVTVNSPVPGISAASLSVETIAAETNPTVFDLSDSTIRVKEGAANTVLLTNSRVTVSGLAFWNLSRTGTPGTVRIQFTLTHVNPSGRNEYDFSKTFYGTATLR